MIGMNKGTLTGIAYRWLLLAAAACTAFSCSSRHLDDRNPDPERLPLILKVDSGTGTGVMEQGTTVGAFFMSKAGGDFYRKNEMLIVDAGGRLMQGRDTVVPLHLDAYDFLAYSPYNSSWNEFPLSVVEFDVSTDQSVDLNYLASDLLLSYGIECMEDHGEAVFSHAMAKVMIHITDNTGFYDMRFSSTVLHDMKLRSYIYMAEEICRTEDSLTGDVICNVQDFVDRRSSFSAVVPAQEVKDGMLRLGISLGDNGYDFTIYDVPALEQGKVHVFSMRMTERGLELEDATITGWEDAGEGDVVVANE